ncbi:MAG TPA: SRPBCC domain-containing protein [Bacteroidales bacterium]|nr:SRPBCC domain-containing protein [Bacteroidales bacterium]HPF02695.1 SRPBCC domain-containing protein [Bacteroidales bacterium]HPJ58492.1 SRPBCC domain-containing protein [Bacteroidales bacterium]HPR11667.1 SRPBCC domain-containing protein [Bacteroidales bacterium]HRW85027.1 SRPBCC domain-containing protein [Bacteroidales bacterium]
MKTFKKTFRINAEPSDVYAALTNPLTIELWSGYPAVMSEEPGTEFSLWEGDISGKNLEFVKDRKIVQEWYFGDHPEKSVATILINPDRDDSVVTVEHINIPDEDFADIAEGWREYYIGAIISFFNPNF